MPNYTDFLHLEKPLQAEQYNVDVFNDNCDKIDNFARQIPPRAYTADKLTTGVNINGVFFRGDTDVVTGLGKHDSTVIYNEENIAYKIIDGEAIIKRCLNDETTGDNFNDPTKWLNAINIKGLTFKQISDCVLSTNYTTATGKVLTIRKGTKVLIADGRMSDGYTLKNIEYVIPNDLTKDFTSYSVGQERTIFLTSAGGTFEALNERILGYYMSLEYAPSSVPTTNTYHLFCTLENTWYSTSGSTTANWQPESVIPIVSVHVYANTLGIHNRFAVKLANADMVDGEWESQNVAIASSVTYPTSTDLVYDLSNYIHWDRFAYEVLLSATVTAGISPNIASGDHIYLGVQTDVTNNAVFICGAHTRTTSSVVNVGNVIVPTRSRKITIPANSGYKGIFSLNLRAIRRIGANG